MKKSSLKNAAAAIKKYKSFLISSHTSPEGDAVGSELAFYYLLKKLGKNAVIVNKDPLPQEYDFFPGKGLIKLYSPDLKNIDFDCMAVLDCTDLNRVGMVRFLNKKNKPVLNIDHHISNRGFGDVNLVEPKASSASEVVFKLYKEMRVPLDKDVAVLLYAGMLTDTGSFRYTNTSAFTHKAVAELMRFDFNANQVYRNIYENIPFADMQLLSRALTGIRRDAEGKVAWVEIPAKLLRHKKLSFDLGDHILSFARSIKGVQVVALFRENLGDKKEIRVNFRSNGAVDVNEIAKAFGGGGHKTASGCTISGKLPEVRKKVLAKIRQYLK